MGLLAVVFIVLKLCHVIEWSWWWVLSPLWGQLVFALLVFAVIGFMVWAIKKT